MSARLLLVGLTAAVVSGALTSVLLDPSVWQLIRVAPALIWLVCSIDAWRTVTETGGRSKATR